MPPPEPGVTNLQRRSISGYLDDAFENEARDTKREAPPPKAGGPPVAPPGGPRRASADQARPPPLRPHTPGAHSPLPRRHSVHSAQHSAQAQQQQQALQALHQHQHHHPQQQQHHHHPQQQHGGGGSAAGGERDPQGAPQRTKSPLGVEFPPGDDSGPNTPPGGGSSGLGGDAVVHVFHKALQHDPSMAVAVAAIKALTTVVEQSQEQTMMGINQELKAAAASLSGCNETNISLRAGCDLFLCFTARNSLLDADDFQAARTRVIERGRSFGELSVRARTTIASLGARFIRPGTRVLLHGHSRVVMALLAEAVRQNINFRAVVTEGRPDGTGLATARALDELRVPTTMILDSAVAYVLQASKVDMILLGAEGVLEAGGIVNKLGTLSIAMLAKELNVPVYVAAESYKFARISPLGQQDLPAERQPVDFGPLMPKAAVIRSPSRDYTPPRYVSLLFTDLGVLTPAAVSDELIQLYA